MNKKSAFPIFAMLLALSGCEKFGSSTATTTSASSKTVYSVTGTLRGLTSALLVLQNNGKNDLTISANGKFIFSKALATGTGYAVTVKTQPAWQTCAVSNGSGIIESRNVVNVLITCQNIIAVEKILHSFGKGSDGQNPYDRLFMDASGNMYGTTYFGGRNGKGTVFKITHDGIETVLYSFGMVPDGQYPTAALFMGSKGNLYGTTNKGGKYGNGTIFKIAPDGVETILQSFYSVNDEKISDSSLVMGSRGNQYGTTYNGGTYKMGTVFKIAASGTKTILHSFGALADGKVPDAGLIIDSGGNLYGTTNSGGAHDLGTVFKIAPNGVETVLHSFGVAPDGRYPEDRLVMDASGNLYGTTANGGANNGAGIVFKITP